MRTKNIEIRIKLAEAIKRFYNRLRIPLTPIQTEYLERIEHLNIIECGHGWFFPILGMFRLPLMATTLIKDDQTIVLFRCNDDYTKQMHYSTRELGFYQKGLPGNQQRSPIVVKCPKKKILRYVAPPSKKDLYAISDKIKVRFHENFSYTEREYESKLRKKEREEILDNVDRVIRKTMDCTEGINSYADWCERFNISILKSSNPIEYDKIFFISNIDLIEMFQDYLKNFLENSEEFVRIINDTAVLQITNSRGMYKKNVRKDFLPFWFLCPRCLTRNRGIKEQAGYSYICNQCGTHSERNFSDNLDFILPDAITKQTMTSLLNPVARVVGGIKPYSILADVCTEKICKIGAPPRIVLSTRPHFYGIGETQEGSTHTTLLRSIIEVKPETLGRLLITPWHENPVIRSKYIHDKNV